MIKKQEEVPILEKGIEEPKKYKQFYCCDCNDFFEEPHNHSPQSSVNYSKEQRVPEDTPSGARKAEGTFNLSDKIKELREGAIECRKEAPLRERIEKWDWFLDHLNNIEKDVKEAAKRLKNFVKRTSYMNFRTRLLKEIDKIMGKDLI